MQLFIDSSFLNKFIFLLGISTLIFSFILIILILLFRNFTIKKRYEIIKFYRIWNPIFLNINSYIPISIPKVENSNEFHLLKIFNKTFEKNNTYSQTNLLKLADILDIKNIAIKMLDYDNSIYKIVALKTIGHLKIKESSSSLYKSIKHENIIIILITIQSLVKISYSNLDKLIPFLIFKDEVHINKIILVLSSFDKEEIEQSIKKSIPRMGKNHLPRLIQLFGLIDKNIANEEAKKILLKYQDKEIISNSILFITNENEKNFLFSFIDNKSWVVRMQAIKSLNNMLLQEDIKIISKLLLDKSWWVRHYTADAIVSIKFITDEYLDNFEEILGDKFAIDALKVARRKRNIFDSI